MDLSPRAGGYAIFHNDGNSSSLLKLRSLDVLVSALAICGIVLGFISIWSGFKSRRRGYQPKLWLLGGKILTTSVLFSVTLAQLCLAPGPHTHAIAQGFVLLSVAVVLLVHCLEPWQIRPLNLLLSVYWILLFIAQGLLIRLSALQPPQKKLPVGLVLLFLQTGFVAVQFLLAFLTSPATSPPNTPENGKGCPAENAGLFSMFTFSWMTPIMKHGYGNFLTRDDLWDLRRSDQANTTGHAFQDSWEKELRHGEPKLWRVLLRAFGGPYLQGSLFKLVGDLLVLVQPQLLRRLIRFADSHSQQQDSGSVLEGVFIALSMFGVSLIQTAFNHQNIQRAFETGTRFRSSLTSMLYRKSLKLSTTGKGSKSTGDILNLMVADTQKIQDLAQSGPQLWSAPLQITLCMVSLYQLLGPSMFAGVAVMILMSPVSTYISKVLKTLQKRQMKNKDARMRLIAEILRNIKSLKLFAWDRTFLNKLNTVRNERELKTLRSIGLTQSLANLTWATTPFLVTCTTFTIFVLTSNRPLSSDIVFPALALFNILALPLNIFPLVISSFAEGSVAAARLVDFLCAEEVQPDAVDRQQGAAEVGEETVQITKASFGWGRGNESPVLHGITYAGYKGKLSCVIGRVGSGKSALLQAILGELWKVDGSVSVNGSIAYAAQRPWLLDASVRDNIVFGNAWDAELYDRTVHACALSDDFDAFPDRDDTEIGERGIQLSGGQKARVALARAVYSCADIFILDDCLSAVDQHVGRHIINHLLGADGLLAEKTRILATNSLPVLREADDIAFLAEGRIVEQGTYTQLIGANGEMAAMIRNSTGGVENLIDDGGVVTGSKDSSCVECGGLAAATGSSQQVSNAQGPPAQKPSTFAPGQFHAANKGTSTKAGAPKMKTSKETSKQGKVEWAVYQQYGQAGGAIAIVLYFVALISAQSASIGGGFWLKHWSETSREHDGNIDVVKYICVYFALGMGSALLVLAQSLVFWMLFSLKASKTLHEQMAVAIFRSPMRYFETTPNGLVINRFSSDIYRIDQNLPRVFNMLFENCAKAFFSLGVIIISTPVATALILPLGFLYQSIQKYYLRASRELKRLESGSKSPIFSHYQETLDGLTTIRAYQKEGAFSRDNERRVDENIKAFYPSISARRWLGVRLEFIGSVILLAAASSAIFSVYRHAGLSSSMIGLAMSYALQVTQSLNWIIRQGVEAEINIVSAERVLEIARLPSEAPEEIPPNKPPAAWPTEGVITMVNYSARYRAGLDLALGGVNLSIRPRERIGVVGRTGAGKSSLALALFRIIEPAAGQIMIDGLDISKMGLLDLRGRLSIIPQDPALFEGTIRENLDPRSTYDDSEIWSALDRAQLKNFVSESQGKLEMEIREGGSNLSQGQRQLVSLARALLRPSSILVLDEATAAIDPETDAVIQAMLRGDAFKDRTVITIAHRISTVLDSDRIVVLDRGKVVEFETPANLIHREEGLFYELAKEANLLDAALGQEGRM